MEKYSSRCSFGSIFGLENILKFLTCLQLIREVLVASEEFLPGVHALLNFPHFGPPQFESFQNLVLHAFLWLGSFLVALAILTTINPRNGRMREFKLLLCVFAYFSAIPIGNTIFELYEDLHWTYDLTTKIFTVFPQVPILILGIVHYFRYRGEVSKWDYEARVKAGEKRPLIIIQH